MQVYLECCELRGWMFGYTLATVARCECSITDLVAILVAMLSGIEQLIFFTFPVAVDCTVFFDYSLDDRRLLAYFL